MKRGIIITVLLTVVAFTIFLLGRKVTTTPSLTPMEEASYKSDRHPPISPLPAPGTGGKQSRQTPEQAPRFAQANLEKRIAQMGTVQELQERQRIILTPAEVLARAGEPSGREGVDPVIRQSLDHEVWGGKAHLLVQELNLGRGIALTHQQVMEFLAGAKGGWSDNYYRWIADELMTILREDLPDGAYQDFTSLITNTSLDDGIRGYSLQHVGHLMDQGVDADLGHALMWELAQGSDPALKSTALIGLYQYAKLHPESQDIAAVMELAEELANHPDRDTAVTAQGILKSES